MFFTTVNISLDSALTKSRTVAGGETQQGCHAPGGTRRGLGEGVAAAQGTGTVQIYSTSLIPAISLVCSHRHH